MGGSKMSTKANFIGAIVLLGITGLAGCATGHLFGGDYKTNVNVKTVVSSYDDEAFRERLEKRPVLNFISYSKDDIRYRAENREVVRACMEAAEVLGFKTELDKTDCSGCVDVLTMHKFELYAAEGDVQMSCSSYYGGYYQSLSCSTYRPVYRTNNRWLGLTFMDPSAKKTIHQIDGYSTGNTQSVTQVALEMCYAVLLDFPKRFENSRHTVSRDLEYERRPASAGH